jgi:ankyrin repeat protein
MIRKEPEAWKWGPPLCEQVHQSGLHDLDTQDHNGNSLLSEAVRKKLRHLVGVLLQLGVNPNLQNKRGETPLMHAARSKRKRMIMELLGDERVNTALVDNEGKTAEDYAPNRYRAARKEVLNTGGPRCILRPCKK